VPLLCPPKTDYEEQVGGFMQFQGDIVVYRMQERAKLCVSPCAAKENPAYDDAAGGAGATDCQGASGVFGIGTCAEKLL
jgi:hypothetical protein